MKAIIDAWIRRNYAHDVTFDLAPQLQELIAAAVQAERNKWNRAVGIMTRHMSAEQIAAAQADIEAEEDAAIRARSNGGGSK